MQQSKRAGQEIRLWGVPHKPRLMERIANVVEHIIVLVVLLLFLSFVQTVTAAEPDYDNVKQGTLFYRAAHDGQYRTAPLLNTDVDMRVTGFINRTHLTQTFHNRSDDWVEGIYVFPLPENAAVDHMRIRIGKRVIEGQIKEKQQAKQIYEQAKHAGKRASLVEQERPNMFTTSVANIGPHETVNVEIEYQQSLVYDQGQFRLRLPLAITPRYIPGVATEPNPEQAGTPSHGFAQPTTQVPDADRITPLVAADQKINPVSVHIELDAGFPVSRIKSSYHPVSLVDHGEGRYTINLAEGQVPSDHDFELVWEPEAGQAPQTALFSERVGEDMYYLGMVLPPRAETQQTQTLAREVIYVIDTSGSMGGVSIRQARNALLLALKRLRSGDYFNVIQFNSVTSQLFDYPKPANQLDLALATNYVESLEAGGGTEMMGAMQEALAVSEDSPRLRQVIFLTDGAVGNEDALFEYIRHHLGNSRLFTVGIGSAPNSHFMTKAAQFGRGTYTYVSQVSEVEAKMQELFAKLDSPVMRDLSLQHTADGFELSPAHLPDLYLGEPLLFTARSHSDSGELILKGLRQNQPWQTRLYLQQAKPGNGIAQLWARDRIAGLLDSVHDGADADQVRQQVITLALQHHMVSKYTSLVAVDVTPVRPAATPLHSLAVPVNLPQGQDASKIFAMQAQSGTAQYLYWLLGFVLLGMASALKIFSQRGGPSCAA
jgi:Ca-activated chloride channel family protein